MSLRAGLVRAGQSRASPRRSAGTSSTVLTLESAKGWPSLEGDRMAMSRDRAMKISTVDRCVEVLSNSMAVLPVYIMDEGTKKRLARHRLGRVLWGRANEAMSTYDYERLMLCNQLLRGNAYAWVFRDQATGHPRELIPLPPDHVEPWLDWEGRLWYRFRHPKTGELYDLRPEDLLHYKAYSEDGIRGISVLRRAALTLDTAQAAQEYEHSTWRSGGQPSGILTTEADLGGTIDVIQEDGTVKKVDPKEHLRRSWEKVHRGPGNAMRLAVLDLGLKYQPISMNNTDAQFVESNEVRVADVCRFFGVPLHLAYAGKQSYQSNEQNGIEYVNYTLLGYETQWSQEDSYKLLLPGERERDLRIKRELKVFLRGDTASQAAWYKAMREVSALSPDEIRALEDMGTIPGGSSYYASWNYGPLDQWARQSVSRTMGRQELYHHRQEEKTMDRLLKSATVAKQAVGEAELALINAQTLRPLAAEEVFTFRLAACDDQTDRDYERFTAETLEGLATMFIGKSVLMDHAWRAGSQMARVYAAGVEDSNGARRLILRCYMPRTEQTSGTITAIEAGILRECSVGCAVRRVICSVCGADQTKTCCPHVPGREYDGHLCVMKLDGAKDAYEVSLVAVPAQPEAGVIKAKRYGGAEHLEGDSPQRAEAPDGSLLLAQAAQELEEKRYGGDLT